MVGGILPLPPADCLDYPFIGVACEGLHNQVVEMNEVEGAVSGAPFLHRGEPNVCLQIERGWGR